MTRDLTVGSPPKILVQFALPLMGSVAFQQLYSIMDGIIAGRCINADALAAVGASYPITMIFTAIALGLNSGGMVLCSQKFGARQMEEFKTASYTSIITAVLFGVIAMVVGFVICNPMMTLLNTPANIYADSAAYLRIYCAGLIFVFLYNICNGIFSSMGDSMTPFLLLVVSSVSNIALDALFVMAFHWGVPSVALATLIAQAIGGVWAIVILIKRLRKMHSEMTPFFSAEMFKKVVLVSIPSILQQSFVSVCNLFIQRYVNGYGSAVIAGYSAAIKLNTFAIMLFGSLSNALTTFSAQNFGARKMERIRQGLRYGILLSLILIVPVTLLYVLAGDHLMMLFMTSANDEAVHTGQLFLWIAPPFYFVLVVKVMHDAVLRGAAAMKTFMISTFADLFLRIILAYWFQFYWGSTGIWLAWPFTWGIGMVIAVGFYRQGGWKKKHMNL
ncbi:MAG: MATE family efflux transporter [Eubacterium sp.]|nr:MATE family efflux transporter [Eubacterium sp.]